MDSRTAELNLEVISLSDDEEEERSDEMQENVKPNEEQVQEQKSSDEIEGNFKTIVYLDEENKKIHEYLRITKVEVEPEFVNIEDDFSDSDDEEVKVIDDKKAYITIDPEDYKNIKNNQIRVEKSSKPNKNNIKDLRIIDKRIEGSSNDMDINNLFKCQHCNFVCAKDTDLFFHIGIKHTPENGSERTYTSGEIQELEREMKDHINACHSCNQALWYLPTLRAHAVIHPKGMDNCEACNHAKRVTRVIMSHLESHAFAISDDDDDL